MTNIESIRSAIESPNFSHARLGHGCWKQTALIYHHDADSPTNVRVVASGGIDVVDPILKQFGHKILGPQQ